MVLFWLQLQSKHRKTALVMILYLLYFPLSCLYVSFFNLLVFLSLQLFSVSFPKSFMLCFLVSALPVCLNQTSQLTIIVTAARVFYLPLSSWVYSFLNNESKA
ncbi:hypothetical protein ATANTOWER_025563 [Ataeniobius toweri]|uniref:Uncharacterized protein n=1 Tax=Ataeniobius toweri TaxID=208326 RepID=A0ABU7AC84_9TELE|nr:hypothetical protein [Ataeniobius toweri]